LAEKHFDNDYYCLTLVAIAKELKAEGLTEADVVIAAGLPLTWTSGQKKEFAEYLRQKDYVEYVYQDILYRIHIVDVKVYPQGYSAIAPFASSLHGLSVLADIGNGTMNTLYLVNGRPQSGQMFTEKFGTYQCTLAIREGFMRETRRELNDIIIDEVLCNGTADIPISDLNIIKRIAEDYVADIFRRLREHGYDENTMKLIVSGGGGCLIKHFGNINPDRVEFIDDICAAAKGYEYIAEIKLKAEQAHAE
jgi:plasmid segregation protein ParM